MHPTAKCPKCNRLITAEGEVTAPGVAGALPVYQCDQCRVTADFLGESVELPLTFVVDGDGRAVDPAAPDEEPPWRR